MQRYFHFELSINQLNARHSATKWQKQRFTLLICILIFYAFIHQHFIFFADEKAENIRTTEARIQALEGK